MIAYEEARALLKAVPRFSSAWRKAILWEEDAEWFGVIWTRVVLLLAGEPIEYVGGQLTSDSEDIAGDLHVYSPTRLIRATVGLSDEGELEVAVWAIARRSLQRVGVAGGSSVFGPRAGEDWPGEVAFVALYPDEAIELPGAAVSDGQKARFLEFLPSLMSDLGVIH